MNASSLFRSEPQSEKQVQNGPVYELTHTLVLYTNLQDKQPSAKPGQTNMHSLMCNWTVMTDYLATQQPLYLILLCLWNISSFIYMHFYLFYYSL